MNTQPQIVEIDEKAAALAEYLNISIDEIENEWSNTYDADGCEYLVLTDGEANEYATDYIKESLWAFNVGFLSSETGLPEEIFTALQPQCEGANDSILKLLELGDGLENFADSAICADGRGHFMSSYDGEENEQGEYFIYRTN